MIPAAESSLIGMLETVLGPLWVWLVLSERPGAASLTGGALILAALLANTLVASSRRAGLVAPVGDQCPRALTGSRTTRGTVR